MPRLSALGSAVMGQRGIATTSVDGAIPTPLIGSVGGGWDWLADNLIGGQASIPTLNGGAWFLYSVNLDTLATPSLLAAQGANNFAAGGGKWAAFLSVSGVHSNIAGLSSLPDAGMGSIDRDGTLALNTNFGLGSGVTVYSAAGATLQQIATTMAGYGAPYIRCRSGMVTYPTASGFPLISATTGGTVPGYLQQADIYIVIPLLLGSKPVVVEYNAASSMWSIRRADQPVGLTVNTSGTLSYGMDAIGLNGLVRLAWSTGPGELADELVLLDVDTATGGTTRGTVVGGMIVWADGPTLEGTTFDMTGAGSVYVPYQQPLLDAGGKTISRPWRDAFNQMANGLQTVTTTVNSIPPPVPPPSMDGEILLATPPTAGLPVSRQVLDSPTVAWDFTVPNQATASADTSGLRSLMLTIASLRA